jgi:hypothetical protein
MLEKPGYGFFVVAKVDGKNIGVLLISYEFSDWRNSRFYWINCVRLEIISSGICRERP